MQCIFEWKAQHAIDVTPGDYFSTSLIIDGQVVKEYSGRDEFQMIGMLLPEKRVAGLGREKVYSLADLPAGLSALEADPSQPIQLSEEMLHRLVFQLNTNVFLDQGLLSHYISLGVKINGSYREIPLQSPAVAVDWQSRGKYLVQVHDL